MKLNSRALVLTVGLSVFPGQPIHGAGNTYRSNIRRRLQRTNCRLA